MIESVLFDLDGTLVHTAPGILGGFRQTLTAAGVPLVTPIDERVIGPPLLATLERLTGITDAAHLDRLATAFKQVYDTDGVRAAEPYPGTEMVLDALRAQGRRLFVVTNKRAHPTRLILERLGWWSRFEHVYSPDSLTPPAKRKAAVVAHLVEAHGVRAGAATLVGDSAEDGDAAGANAVPFVAARYGYGTPIPTDGTSPVGSLGAITELPDLLGRLD